MPFVVFLPSILILYEQVICTSEWWHTWNFSLLQNRRYSICVRNIRRYFYSIYPFFLQLLPDVFHGKKKALPLSMREKSYFQCLRHSFLFGLQLFWNDLKLLPILVHYIRYEITISALYVMDLNYMTWCLGHEQSNIGIILYTLHYSLHYFHCYLPGEVFILLLALRSVNYLVTCLHYTLHHPSQF